MARRARDLPSRQSFPTTLRCNSHQFEIAKGFRRDVLLTVFAQAKRKLSHCFYSVWLNANHLQLLIKPDDARQLPRLKHCFDEYSAMALNRLRSCRRCFEKPGITPIALNLKTTDEC